MTTQDNNTSGSATNPEVPVVSSTTHSQVPPANEGLSATIQHMKHNQLRQALSHFVPGVRLGGETLLSPDDLNALDSALKQALGSFQYRQLELTMKSTQRGSGWSR